ncbi:glycosyltransferase family 2 protein [candidate division KSB1 bacterium]
MKTGVFVVIAAYDEGKSIGNVLKGLIPKDYEIVVVDDCSKDNTFNIVENIARKNKKVHLLRHIVNRGQGAALKTGIDYSLAKKAKIIVTFDADGQHQADEIKDIIRPVQAGEVDAALGSRFLNRKSNVPFFKKLALKGGTIFTKIISGIKLTDAHNGFRALSREAAKKIKITQDRMEHASEIVEEIHKKRIKYKEVPVTIKYTKYSKAKGQGALNAFKIAFRFIFKKLTS